MDIVSYVLPDIRLYYKQREKVRKEIEKVAGRKLRGRDRENWGSPKTGVLNDTQPRPNVPLRDTKSDTDGSYFYLRPPR